MISGRATLDKQPPDHIAKLGVDIDVHVLARKER